MKRSSAIRGAAKPVDHRTEQKRRHRAAKFGSGEFWAPGRKSEKMREDHIPGDPQDNTRPFIVDAPERLSAPMGLLIKLYYDAGRNEDQLEQVLERIGHPKKGVAADLRDRILQDLAEIRGTPWLLEPRVRVDGSAYSNSR